MIGDARRTTQRFCGLSSNKDELCGIVMACGVRRPPVIAVTVFASPMFFAMLCSLPVAAAPSSCQRELGSTDITLIKSVLHLRGIGRAPEDQQCAVYRQHVATVSKVRQVFERCLSGAKREVCAGGFSCRSWQPEPRARPSPGSPAPRMARRARS